MTNEVKPSHSPRGASNCERWGNCPGSIRLIPLAPPQRPSEYAAEGTLAHSVCAALVLDDPDLLYELGPVGSVHKVDGFDIEITDEMMESVMVYVDFINEQIETNKLQFKHHVFIEHRIVIPGVDDEEDLFGTADAILHVPYKKLIVVDYKHGAGVKVDVHDNKQLQYYALGALLSMPDMVREEIPYVEMVVVQPRCFGGGIERVVITCEQLQVFHQWLITAAKETFNPDAPLIAGDHCKWCPAKPICPALRSMVVADAGANFVLEDDPPLPAIAEMTPEIVSRLLMAEERIKEYFKVAADAAMGFLERGIDVPGLKLIEGVGRRAYIDPQAAEKKLLKEGHKGIYTKPKLLSPAQLEKVVGKTLVADLVFKPSTGKKIAKESDKREKVKGAISDFDGVTIDVT